MTKHDALDGFMLFETLNAASSDFLSCPVAPSLAIAIQINPEPSGELVKRLSAAMLAAHFHQIDNENSLDGAGCRGR